MTRIGLCLQGGGATAAYEAGACRRLYQAGLKPAIVSAVSTGAVTAAVLCSAGPDGPVAALDALWDAITVKAPAFVPAMHQRNLALFGNPAFYRPRGDYYKMASWTSFYDTAPLRETLDRLVDWDRLNWAGAPRLILAAADVATGQVVRFDSRETPLTVDHVVAAASLPPSFPMTALDGARYWDGGLFDAAPMEGMIAALDDAERAGLPIWILDVVPAGPDIPGNMEEVNNRVAEMQFQNRYWERFGGIGRVASYAAMLQRLDAELPAASPLRDDPDFRRLMRHTALGNLHVIACPHRTGAGAMDFSATTVAARLAAGAAACDAALEAAAAVKPKTRRSPRTPGAAAE